MKGDKGAAAGDVVKGDKSAALGDVVKGDKSAALGRAVKGGKMDLMIGGRAQGKLALALQRHPNVSVLDESASIKMLRSQGRECWIWNHFHLFVKDRLEEGLSAPNLREAVLSILEDCPGAIVICDEVGNGIVPMTKEERIWREETGRLLCRIAERAENVERVICGIPVKIKG